MTTKNDGGAFHPLTPDHASISKYGRGPGVETGSPGISVRDYFAGMALQGILSGQTAGLIQAEKEGEDPGQLASEAAYQYADAMLKAREK